MGKKTDKRMNAQEAVAEFIHDGDELIIGNYTLGMACGLIYEVVRQKKKGLTHCSQSGHLIDEVLVAGGCVDRLVTAYVVSVGGDEGGSAVGRAWKKGELQFEEYTNFNYNTRLVAGMHGFSFMTVFEGIIHTDLFAKRGFMGENKYKVISCPYRRFGLEAINRLKARAFYSTPANYGAAFTSAWDENDRERTMGVTLAEMEQFMKDRGVLYE